MLIDFKLFLIPILSWYSVPKWLGNEVWEIRKVKFSKFTVSVHIYNAL